MRKLIAAFRCSLDGKIEGSEGHADWVDGWSDDYGLTTEIDACLLGGRMYRGYEQYWTAIQQNETNKSLPMTGKLPTQGEIKWAGVIKQTPHYVFSNTLTSALWSNTKFIRSLEEIAALKQQSGKNIYLMGGAQIAASLFDAGLVDELRLIVYPLLAGKAKGLFAASERRRPLELRKVQQLESGLVYLVYGIS